MSTAPEAGPQLYTGADLERLSDAGYRYELVLGELRPMSPAGYNHGKFTGKLSTPFQVFIDEHDLGEYTMAETGFYVSHEPDTVLAPDWAFIRADRVPDPSPDSFADIIPDLVVETRSPSQPRPAIADKVQQWLNAGVRVVLDLDPRNQTVTIHRTGTPAATLRRDDTLVVEDVFPGLQIPLTRVFRRVSAR